MIGHEAELKMIILGSSMVQLAVDLVRALICRPGLTDTFRLVLFRM